jgi:alkylation response protein AidB-like acyl-CoA dehydrogenase
MNLTEPQAGSDLNAVKTRAERAAAGTYRVFGQKIFITYGEHDMADNIVHLVLARLPDAPQGTRGLSLFLVPKFLVEADGSLGDRNDVRCASVEHKLGIHASPTCVMIYGDAGGATGWLVGEENRGLAAMFVMMNSARLGVGMQGVAIGERAFQRALAYARERRQGRSAKGGAAMSPIVEHPDVQRMLMTMKALVQAARGICHLTAVAIDRSFHAPSAEERAAAGERAALLTPVAKAFSSDIGDEVASLGVQVHGGMGYIEETGAAQHMRDSRIAAIYEGANGVQAIDLVQRKLPLSGGAVAAREIAGMRAILAEVAERGEAGFGATAKILSEAIDALEQATAYMREALGADPASALSGASAYLRLFGLALGGACLAKAGLAAQDQAARGDETQRGRIGLARFFAEKLATAAPGLARSVLSGAGALEPYESVLGETA